MHADLVGNVLGAVSESQRSRATSAGTPAPFANLITEFSLGDAEDFPEFVIRLSKAIVAIDDKSRAGHALEQAVVFPFPRARLRQVRRHRHDVSNLPTGVLQWHEVCDVMARPAVPVHSGFI